MNADIFRGIFIGMLAALPLYANKITTSNTGYRGVRFEKKGAHISLNRILVAVIFSLYVSGCASVHSNILAAEDQTGHVYSGVSMDVLSVKCMWAMVPQARKEEGTSILFSAPVAAIGSLVYLIDIPFSFVADTLYLPIDLKYVSENERWTPFTPCYEESRSDVEQ